MPHLDAWPSDDRLMMKGNGDRQARYIRALGDAGYPVSAINAGSCIRLGLLRLLQSKPEGSS